MTTTNPTTYREYAMRFGTYMGIYWIIKFIFLLLGFSIPLLQLLFILLTLFVPILGYIYVRRYREQYCEGEIPFFRAFGFTFSMYLFATMLTAMAHYIYFQFIDHGFLINTYQTQLEHIRSTAQGELVSSIDQLIQAIQSIGTLTPLQLTFQLISQNIFYSILMALPIGLLVMKHKKQPIQ